MSQDTTKDATAAATQGEPATAPARKLSVFP